MDSFGQTVRADLHRYCKRGGVRGFVRTYFVEAGFRVTFWYRVARHMGRRHRIAGKFFTLWLLRYQHQTGVQLNPGTDIGPGLYIPHFGNIVVNPRSRIGKNCYLSHGVTLGKAHSGPRKGVPQVGDDVFIGPGVVALGNLTIGDNAAIGANSVVLCDVPSGCFAAGAPAKVVRQTGAREILGYDAPAAKEHSA